MFTRFLPYQVFPGQATVFLRQLFEHAVQRNRAKITQADTIVAFTRLTGLPEVLLKDELPLDPASVMQDLRRSVIGQEEAVRTVAGFATTFKAGMNDPNRPIGSLLFCGPTGVGKTQLAKTLSQFLFGHGDQVNRLIRLDMSEYAGPDAAERFLHDPDNRPSQWIRRIRRQPFAVVLFDEIEKAAPAVFDVLLSALDEGRLTDQYGRVTILRSAVLIMTSNLGAQSMGTLGFGRGPGMVYEDEAEGFFRPEFLNRIDAMITFEPLNQQTASAIVAKELGEIAAREGLVKAGLRLSWTERLVHRMVEVGIDPRYGARPLQRTLEAKVVGPLARFLLERPGIQDQGVCMDINNEGGICFAMGD
jgi:ATP-dependent Clp protease ATP-binding subunit ClpC